MAERTLFLAWHGAGDNHLWFPVGRLDADVPGSNYRFRYTAGAKRAQKEARFPLLMEYRDLDRDYGSPELFPLFQNRVMSPSRPDFYSYLKTLGLREDADPIEILTVNGGERVTDRYEVFPKPSRQPDGSFLYRFFLHGWRYASESGQERIKSLEPEEELIVALELNNPVAGLGLQIQTTDYQMIGWAPHYLVNDIAAAAADGPAKYEASVVRLNPQPIPSKQRLMVELRCYWDKHEPMTGEDYRPLVD
jgi:hypothetical protein